MIKKFFKELMRRGVVRALGAYIAIVWLLAQGFVDLFPAVGLPEWAIRVFLSATVLAAPLVAFLSWRYDLTRKGFLRDRVDVALAKRRARPIAGQIDVTRTTLAPAGPRSVLGGWQRQET